MQLNYIILFILINILSSCVGGRSRMKFWKPKVTSGRVYSKPASSYSNNHHYNQAPSQQRSGFHTHYHNPAYSQSHPVSSSGSYNYHSSAGANGYHAPTYNPPIGLYSHTTIINQGSSSRSSDLATFYMLGALSHSHHHHYHGGGGSGGGGGNNTTIINNNYGSSSVSGNNPTTGQASNGNVGKVVGIDVKFTSPTNVITTNHEIEEFTESILSMDNNYFKKQYITTKFQGLKTYDNEIDEAADHFLTVKRPAFALHIPRLSEMNWRETSSTLTKNTLLLMGSGGDERPWDEPTFKTLLALYDNYFLDVTISENVTEEQRNEENDFINAIVETNVMRRTQGFLSQRGYVSNDLEKFKTALKDMWFTRFERTENVTGSSGFEYVFLAERYKNKIYGLHNWIYYAHREADEQLNYLGYIGNVPLGDYGTFAKVKSTLDGTVNDATTLFVGFSPELEMSLYTLCFYISPNQPCPIKLAGNQFRAIVLKNQYKDKNIVVSVDVEYEPPPQIESKGNNASQICPLIFEKKIIFLILIILFHRN